MVRDGDTPASTVRGTSGKIRLAICCAAIAVAPLPASATRLLEDLGELDSVEASRESGCPLYVGELESAGARRKLEVRGRIANAGPGHARLVMVELAVLDEQGETIAAYRSRPTPQQLRPGASANFSLRIPGGDWHRALQDVGYGRTRVSLEAVRCDDRDPGPRDAAGRTRSDYRRLAFSAAEERVLLGFQVDDAREERIRLEIRDVSRRRKEEASDDLALLEARRRSIDRYLEEELPLAMRSADAPSEWLEDLDP